MKKKEKESTLVARRRRNDTEQSDMIFPRALKTREQGITLKANLNVKSSLSQYTKSNFQFSFSRR